jgi:hypothetical protein
MASILRGRYSVSLTHLCTHIHSGASAEELERSLRHANLMDSDDRTGVFAPSSQLPPGSPDGGRSTNECVPSPKPGGDAISAVAPLVDGRRLFTSMSLKLTGVQNMSGAPLRGCAASSFPSGVALAMKKGVPGVTTQPQWR